ncbi:MAG: WG repeat-containing protein [Cyanobacteriota bacterium]
MKKIPNTLFVLLFTLLSCQVNDKNNIIPPLKKEIQINKTEDKIKTINNLLVNLKTYSTFEKNGKIGLLDQDNKEIIPPIYQEIQSIQNKFIKVKIDDKWMLFESSGKKLSEEKFDDIYLKKNNIKNIFMLKNNSKYAIFDEKIKKLTDYIYQEINYSNINSLILKTNDKWGAYDFDGKQIIYPKYDILQEVKNNIFIATLDNKSFLLEANSEKIISNKYKYIYVNTNIFNFILVRNEKDNTFLDGLIDVNGKEILEPKYNSISMLNDNYLILELNNKKSLVDKNLNDVLENKYNNISLFNNEYIIGELDGKETIFDKSLKVVESITYPYPDKEGYFLIKKDGKTGLIHKSGTKVAEPKYDHFSFLTDNFISVNIGGKIEIIGAADFGLKPRSYLNGGLYGVIDTSGKVLIKPIYESLYYSNNYFYANSSNTPIRKNRNILFDKYGKKIMESDFNLSEIYKENYIITEDYHIYGLADLNGNNIITRKYQNI